MGMNPTLDIYRDQRDKLLSDLATSLSKEEGFIAAWLTGSFGRNDPDSVSDIDLSLVVSNEYSQKLCQRLEQVSAQTSPERFALFSQFGKPALIHENNTNAPEGGTFTFVLYTESALMVDWVLIPGSNAVRPYQSRLLFDKVGIPVSAPPAPEEVEQSRKSVAEMYAFFWMMTAITIKYLVRKDAVFVTQWIENLYGINHEIERRMKREPWVYIRGSFSKLQTTREKQIESLKKLSGRMQDLQPAVAEFTGTEPLVPVAEIEILLSLVK